MAINAVTSANDDRARVPLYIISLAAKILVNVPGETEADDDDERERGRGRGGGRHVGDEGNSGNYEKVKVGQATKLFIDCLGEHGGVGILGGTKCIIAE